MNIPLLISIYPEFVEKIVTRQKVFEYRKALPSQRPTHLVIYATSPVQKVVAIVEVEDTLTGSPSGIWEKTGKSAGISRALFRQYFSGRKTANAFQLGNVYSLQNHLSLAEINPNLVAPQSYRFLGNADFDMILAQLDHKISAPQEIHRA